MLRQPIIAVLGHVDHGKTTLLDSIRKTAIAAKEAGGITQAIGTTEIPTDTIKTLCGDLLSRFKFSISVPGLLFIDTPGHEAFTTLRKRGGSIADLAILVIDINEGIMPQTEESIQILKDLKTPFVIAVNKIDRLHGWHPGICFLDNFSKQSDSVKGEFEKKFYEIITQMNKYGYEAERFDRVHNFRTTAAAVPVSAKTGEGIPDLLATLVGLAQNFLKDQLITTNKAEGTILEVKNITGLGTVIDSIIYDGAVHKNDFLVVGGKARMITKIKALLMPQPLHDIRTEKKFLPVEECHAACGVRISAAGLDDVVAGSRIVTAPTFEKAEKLLSMLEKEIEQTEIHKQLDGLVLKANTIGSLEALINIFKKYPIEEASIGAVTKQDIMISCDNKNRFQRAIIGFDANVDEGVLNLAKEKDVKIITSNVIYRLIEEYEKWLKEQEEDVKKKETESLIRPGKLRILPGLTFRASNPAIVGCEILGGIVKPGYKLFKFAKEIREVGEIKQIQAQGENLEEAKISDKVAVSIIGPTVGRQIDEGDILYTDISSENYKKLVKNEKFLTEHEKSVMKEIYEMKRKFDPRYGL